MLEIYFLDKYLIYEFDQVFSIFIDFFFFKIYYYKNYKKYYVIYTFIIESLIKQLYTGQASEDMRK